MGERTAFFYGTLMAPGVLYRVIYGSSTPESWQKQLTTVYPALLQSYRRHRVKDADFPAIIPHSGSSVRGTYVTGLMDQDIRRLDIFEGDMYTREKVKVKLLKDDVALDQVIDESKLDEVVTGEADAETYVWTVGIQHLEEKEWDFAEFQKEKMRAWMGEADSHKEGVEVDEGFADVDRAVAEEEEREREGSRGFKGDPSGGRINGSIAQELKNAAI